MKTWWICVLVISIVAVCMFAWAIVSYIHPRKCRCDNCEKFPYGERLREGFKSFQRYDEELKTSLGLTCQQVLAFWQGNGFPQAKLLGSCIHRTWTPDSDIDISIGVGSVEEMVKAAKGLEAQGAHLVHGPDPSKDRPFALYSDPNWSQQVDISLTLVTPPNPDSKYERKDQSLQLPEEVRFLVSYLKFKHPDLKFNIRKKKTQ